MQIILIDVINMQINLMDLINMQITLIDMQIRLNCALCQTAWHLAGELGAFLN
jgi:hypothetical protein